MSRLEEVETKQDIIGQALEAIKNAKPNITQDALTNLNLSAIVSQLADISTTLAIIADKLGGE